MNSLTGSVYRLRGATRLAGLLAGLLFVLANTSLAEDGVEKQKLQKVGKQIYALQKEIKSSSVKIQTLETELEVEERALAKLKKTISHLQKTLIDEQTKLDQLYKEKEILLKLKQKQQSAIVQQINYSYRVGREPRLKLLLNQENPEQVSRLLHYHDYFLKAHASKLSDFLTTLKKLAELELNIKTSLTTLEQRQEELGDQLQQQFAAQKKRSLTLAKMGQSLKQDSQSLQQLQIEKRRLEVVVQKLAQAAVAIALPETMRAFTQQKGKMTWPVVGKLKNRFGQTRNTKIQWDGWMLSTKEGAAVASIHHGRVVFSDYLRGQGLLIVVDHGEGYMSLYAHNQMLLAETGDWVSSGTVIAKAGQTGGQRQSGLYFEIRHNGKPTNPARWLRANG